MSPADNTPNFDAMTPEEIMAWMESLAKRQGANEGFITSADLEIAEIDPSSVQIDEPGYVPYGKDPQKWAEEEAARKAAAASRPRPAAPTAEPSRPAVEVPPPQPETPPPPAHREEVPVAPSAMSWLESLAVDSGLPDLDLSGLGAEITPVTPAAQVPANPIDWLESLAQGQEEETQTSEPVAPAAPAAPAADPFAGGVDPMSWLESLARQQGAKNEEMTTEANLTIPPPEHISQIEGPGYTPYSFDTLGLSERPSEENVPVEAVPETESRLEPADLEDPSAWLDSLASSQGFAPEAASRPKADQPAGGSDIDDIQAALNRGEQVPPDQMERWMSRQLEFGAAREEPVEAYDPDAPAIPAELPDWLIEQVGSAPPEELVTPAPPLIDSITEPPQAANIPDWLKEEPAPENDLDGIFATTTDEVPQQTAAPQIGEEAPDPWAEALEYESQHDVSDVPDWYTRNVNDPERIATVNRRLFGEAEEEALEEAALEPEAELPLGQPTEVPDWLRDTMDEAGLFEAAELEEAEPVETMPDWLAQEMDVAPAVPTPADEIPDWLKAVDADEVPDWLKESLSPTAQAPAPVVPEIQPPAPPPAPTPAPVAVPTPAPAALPPQPVPAAASIDAASVLQDARASSHDLDTRLKQYEALVRANVELDAVTGDLTRLADQHKSNAAIYRVLGDGLMRQGKLQAALDTYRKALNQL